MMGTPIYVSLDYRQYKEFEEQWAKGAKPLESEHKTEDMRFYHKAIRFHMGDLVVEVTGPMVMAPKLPSDSDLGSDVNPDEEAARDAHESEHR